MHFPHHSFLISFVLSTSVSGEDVDDGDEDVYDDEDVEMAPPPPSIPTGAGALPKKKTATKPDPTAAITVGMAAASLKPSVKRYDLSIHFPYHLSPTGYFRSDGKRRVCVDFFSITQHFDNYKAEVSGKTLKLYMKIPPRFFDPRRLDSELRNIAQDRDTIVSAQTDTASMIYKQYGDEDNIWSPPQVVHLPFEVENQAYFKPIWSDGCDKLYAKLSAECVAAGGLFSDKAVHQMYCYLRVIAIGSERAIPGSNKIEEQLNLSPTRH